jgi:hypothetical protein
MSKRPATPRPLALVAFLLLLLVVAPAAWAALDAPLPEEPASVTPRAADGWRTVAPGVLQRDLGAGVTETYAFGPEGIAWEKAGLEAEIARLRALYEQTGDPDVAAALRDQRRIVDGMTLDLSRAPGGSGLQSVQGADGVSCLLTIDRDASAFLGADGPEATASAAFSDTCATYGCTYAYAIAEGKLGGSFRQYLESDGEYCGYGTAQAAAANAAVVADNECYSYGRGQVRVQDSLGNWAYFVTEATNYQCLSVDISGTAFVSVPYGACVSVTWSTTSNHPLTSYQWTWNSSVVGTGSTYSRTFCSHATYSYSVDYTLGLTGWDSYGNSASDSQVVRVTYRGYCNSVAQQNQSSSSANRVTAKYVKPICDREPVPLPVAQ